MEMSKRFCSQEVHLREVFSYKFECIIKLV